MATLPTRTRRQDRLVTKTTQPKNPSPPPAPQLLRLPAVREMTGLGVTKLYSLVGTGQFPKPVVLARARNGQPRTVAWPAHEVHRWISERKLLAPDGIDLPDLPPGWQWVYLDQLLTRIEAGKSFKCEERPPTDSEYGVVKVSAVTWGKYDECESETITDDARINLAYLIKPGDFLFSRANTIELVGACVLVHDTVRNLLLSDKILRLQFAGDFSRWVNWVLKSRLGRNQIEALSTGNQESMRNIGQQRIGRICVPIAPANEMRRIVSKIDELFSRIEEGERALERVRKLVEVYRQSVLKAAVTGELTREWREQSKGQLESGKVLLHRILKARREAWEKAELAKMKAKGIKPAGDKWKQKYQEPAAPDTTDLPELPEGWVWSSVGQLFRVSVGSTPSRKEPGYWNGGIPWVSSGEVAFCRIKETKETISDAGFENSSVKMHPPGTVLLAMIGEGKTRGQAAILDIEACHNQNAASISVSATPIPPEYLFSLLTYRYERVRSISQGGNQPALNADLVKSIEIPLPPLEEIVAICDAIDRQFTALAAIESDSDAWDRLIQAQRQAILRDAFRGALANQDPADEPASMLLEHINAKRDSAATSATKRERKIKANAAV